MRKSLLPMEGDSDEVEDEELICAENRSLGVRADVRCELNRWVALTEGVGRLQQCPWPAHSSHSLAKEP